MSIFKTDDPDRAPGPVSLMTAFWFWLKLGFISFGGPAGQIAIMHEELVERRRWISEKRFLHALNYCMLLPGPEAQQLATYLGWLMHRTWGGVLAGALFVLPSLMTQILFIPAPSLILWANSSFLRCRALLTTGKGAPMLLELPCRFATRAGGT